MWPTNASRAAIAIISDRRITGLSAGAIAELMTELGPLWHERHQARLASRPRKPAIGAGTKHRLLLVDGLLATLVHLRHGPPHDVLACGFGADRSTITRAIGAVRPLLAERGCTVSPGVRLRTPDEVVDHLGSRGRTGIVDAIEIPPPGARTGTGSSPAGASRTPPRPWVLTDGDGRVLFCSPTKPGSCADITHARR